jgi:serine/threonine protein phosphatase PrpC
MTAEVPGEPTFSFFGVFDGHGGKYISDSAARDLLQRILSTEEWKSGARDVETIKSALRSGFIKLDEELKASEEVVTRDDHSGSTAVTALVTPTHVFVANCGDSRSIMVSDGAAIEMSHDHKPYLEAETKRIEEAGGTVAMKRVNGDLAVSRALGDFVYKRSANLPPEKQQVSCEPVSARDPRPGAS